MKPDGINCTVNPEFDEAAPRFAIKRHCGFEPDEEPGWKYKLEVHDRRFLDIDGFHAYGLAHGDSWSEALACACRFISIALEQPDECVFV